MRTHKTASKWEEFKTILQATFQPVDHVYRLREKLTNLKQGSNSIDQYNRAFLNITTQLPGLQFEDVLFHYINGLSERLNYEVKSKSPRTIDAAIAIATQYDHIHAPSRPTADVKAISHRRRLNQGTTSGSKRFLNTNPTSSDKLNCSYCHKRGHHINDCFSRKKATNNTSHTSHSHSAPPKPAYSGSSRRQEPSGKSFPSSNCRKSGQSDAIPFKPRIREMNSIQTNSDQLLRVHGTVGHVTNLLCTLGTASSVSMMSESTARQFKFAIHPSNIQIKSANNAVTSVVGETDSLFIDIHGHSCHVTFIVLHHDDHEILLGLHPRDLLLKIPGTSDPLLA